MSDAVTPLRIFEAKDVPPDARLPTAHGEFRIRVFHEDGKNLDHVALTLGDMFGPDPVLVRIHSECLTGDALGSLRCDCGAQLEAALSAIQKRGWGCLLYLRQEGRGIGLREKIRAYHLQDRGADTLDANLLLGHPVDARDYRVAAAMLRGVDIDKVCLLTNNPDKVAQLRSLDIDVVEQMPLVAGLSEENYDYLTTKVERMGHVIDADVLNGD